MACRRLPHMPLFTTGTQLVPQSRVREILYLLHFEKECKESGERWASPGDQPVQACPAVLTCPYSRWPWGLKLAGSSSWHHT